jgi:hypothetical protein
MKKLFIVFVIATLGFSCKQNITESDLNNLNGYWEIEKVILPNGEKKDYKVNETFDYFKLVKNKGFRTKVMPQADGSYLTNNLKESVHISLGEGSAILHYKTNYAQWKEEIIAISNDKFIVKNQQELVYHYKRPVKFSVK